MLSPREVDPTQLEPGNQNWINTKLQYTHGYGLAANTANSVTYEGLPDFLVRDLPPKGVKELPDRGTAHVLRRAAESRRVLRRELRSAGDRLPRASEDKIVRYSYKGDGGVPLSNMLKRLAFSVRFGDFDLMISNLITPDSRLMMHRNIVDRARAAAPFLKFDNDPYVVVAEGRMYWIIDAYTSTDRFPYSQRVNIGEVLGPNSQLQGRTNYMRNSVKVVVDSFYGRDELLPDGRSATRSRRRTRRHSRRCSNRSTRCRSRCKSTCGTPRACSRSRPISTGCTT